MRTPIAALSLAVLAPAQNVEAPERFADLRAAIAAEVADGHTPSLAVAVLEDGEVVWAEGFGLANVATGAPATADTIYRLASISKPFTATAVMQLVDRKLIDLDAPINRYLDVPLIAHRGTAEQITARRLLNHTGGLPTHWNFFYGDERPPPRAESIRAYGFAAFEPGTRANYSNFAFGVLDHVIGRLGQSTYRDWLVMELLNPLGMLHTDVGVRRGKEQQAAQGYRKDDGQWALIADYGFDHDGASAVRSSANDLMRFARLQIGRGTVDGALLLDEDSALAMRRRTATTNFGIGWAIGTERDRPVLRHNGGMPGVSTSLLVFPEHDAAIAVLLNARSTGTVGRTVTAILDQLFEARAGVGLGGGAGGRREPERPAGRFVGQIAHPDGPLPLVLEFKETIWPFGTGATVQFGDSKARSCRRAEWTHTRVEIGHRHALALGHGDATEAELDFELERTGNGLRGLLYATVDGTCKLPFWVELKRADDKPPDTLRVVSYNVLVGFADSSIGRFLPGAQRRQQIAAWLAAQQPDVVALQEMNGFTEASLRRLAAAWRHPHVALLKENGFPVALTSSAPITNVTRRREGLHHGMLHATTHDTDFVVVHFKPNPGIDYKLAECGQALACYQEALSQGRQAVVLGDFNSIAPADVGRFSREARERYDGWRYLVTDDRPAEIAMTPLLEAGAVDPFALVDGALPAELPLPRIDFILASPDLAVGATAARWLCEPELLQWSDHPPVVVDFDIAANLK